MLIRRVLKFLVSVCFLGLSAFALEGDGSRLRSSDVNLIRPDDRPVPLPWGAQLPFPWQTAKGVWFAHKGEFRSFFSFKIVKNVSSQEKHLQVVQIDADSCEVVSKGMGILSHHTIYAQMRNLGDKRVYTLGLTSFPAKDLPKELVETPIGGKAIVMSISLIGGQDYQTHYLSMAKVSELSKFKCSPQQ